MKHWAAILLAVANGAAALEHVYSGRLALAAATVAAVAYAFNHALDPKTKG